MAAKSLNEDFFMQNAVDEDAWRDLSSELNWSETLLEKYRDKIDWKELSKNRNTLWTISILEKYGERLDWHIFSYYADESVLTVDFIEMFKEKWDWYELSRNANLPLTDEILQKFADKWVWNEIINKHYKENIFADKGIDFYDRYKDFIPTDDKLRKSRLWKEMINQRSLQIMLAITSQ